MMNIKYRNANNEELIKKSIAGDKYALQKLLLIYENSMDYYLFKLTKNRDFIKDIKQDVMIKVNKSIQKLKEPRAFETWLYRIIQNTWQDYVKSEKVRNRAINNSTEIYGINRLVLPQDIILNREMCSKIKGAIERLNRKDKAILYLREVAKLNYNEMVDILHIKEGTIKSKLFRIRKKIKKMLEEYAKSS